MIVPNIINNILPYRKLLVGFSGGLDSTVLLHRLKLWCDQDQDVKLRAIHIHHGLNSNADIWMEHCISICHEWNIPLLIKHVTATGKGLGIEAKARKARYAAYERTLLPEEVLVIGQHLNDQCETFFLALKRGSGPAGLSAMPSRAQFSDTQLLRPLLGETRESLMIWAQRYSLRWIEDESNQDEHRDRNFLRLRIIPLLNKRWPHIYTAVARSTMLCAEQEDLLDELLADELSTLISLEGALKIAPLTIMSIPHRFAILRRWLSNQGSLMPSRLVLNKIWKEVAQAREDATPCLNLNGYNIRRFKGLLWRIKPQLSCNGDMIITWRNLHKPLILPQGMGKVSLKKGGCISLPLLGEPVSIRFKARGKIHIIGRHGGRKLKKIWQELNIPPWRRTAIPLLFYGEKLIAAAGEFVVQERSVKNGMRFELEL